MRPPVAVVAVADVGVPCCGCGGVRLLLVVLVVVRLLFSAFVFARYAGAMFVPAFLFGGAFVHEKGKK